MQEEAAEIAAQISFKVMLQTLIAVIGERWGKVYQIEAQYHT